MLRAKRSSFLAVAVATTLGLGALLASSSNQTAAGGSDGRSPAAPLEDPLRLDDLGDETLPEIEPFTVAQVAENAPKLSNLRVGNGGTRFAGDGTLLTTISPNDDGFRDRAIVRFSLDQAATVQIAAYLTGSGLKKKIWGKERRFGPGSHRMIWDPLLHVPPRTYLLRLTVTGRFGTRIYGWNRPYFTGFPQGPVVRVQGVDAGFRRPGYRPGALASLRISTDAPRLTLQIFQAGPAPETMQRNDWMDGIPVTAPRALDWRGRRSSGHSVSVRIGHWRSGLYYARLTPGDGRVGFAPFVLRPRSLGVHPVAVVLPTNTWQAYNFRDGNGNGWGETWYVTPRNRNVGLARPHLDRGVPFHFRGLDFGFLRWLHTTGKEADFFSDTDFESIADARSLAARYRLIVFPGHHEYVSSHAYDLTQRFRNLGGNLAFLSANNFFRRVDRVGSSLHLVDLWRNLGRPEERLVGVHFIVCCNGFPFGPYVVTADGRAPWFFAGTGLSNGDTFGHGGIEIDARTELSPPGAILLARIPDLFGPGRSAEMTFYRRDAGGAEVFAAGTLNFGGSTRNPTIRSLLDNLWQRLSR
jgi:N,N-dimethylformamidase beta subunit-like protein